MKRGGCLHPARPDCWPTTKLPRATPGGLIAASVTWLSRREDVPPCLRTSPPLGGTLEVHRTSWRIPFPRHACTFFVLRTISSMSTRPQVCVSVAASVHEGSRTQPPFSHPLSCRCEDPSRSRSTGHGATENWAGKLWLLGGRKKYEVSVAVAKMEDVDQCISVAD